MIWRWTISGRRGRGLEGRPRAEEKDVVTLGHHPFRRDSL